MNYKLLKERDTLNGPGLRVVLVSCYGDSDSCKPFTEDTLTEIVAELDSIDDYNGFTFSGDDPLSDINYKTVRDISRTLRAIFGNSKSIWIYTSRSIQSVLELNTPDMKELLDYIDVIVNGKQLYDCKTKMISCNL